MQCRFHCCVVLTQNSLLTQKISQALVLQVFLTHDESFRNRRAGIKECTLIHGSQSKVLLFQAYGI